MRHPTAVATLEALRIIPNIMPLLPPSILTSAPDYKSLRVALLGIPWEQVDFKDPGALRLLETEGAVSDDAPITPAPTTGVAP